MNIVELEITYSDGRQETVVVDAERVLVGSGAHCDLRLPADAAANEHIVLEIVGETVWVQALAFEPPPMLDDGPVRRATVNPGSRIFIGALQIRVTPTAIAADAKRVQKKRAASGSTALRVLGATALVLLGGVAYLLDAGAPAASPTNAPELFAGDATECPVTSKVQAAALAADKRISADGKRERHPFYVAEGIEAVLLYEQAAACFRVAEDDVLADELATLARQLRTEVIDDARVRRLRLERALATGDKEVGAREVVALRALYFGKQGPYVSWLSGVARRLNVDKELQ